MKTKKQNLYPVFIMIVFFFLAIMLFLFLNHSSYYVLKEDGFQILNGEKLEYPAKTEFEYRELGPAVKGAEKGNYIPNSPIYLSADKNRIVIPDDSIYISGEAILAKKVKSFTKIRFDSILYYKEVKLMGGFIFDGRNTYTFLEPVTLEINGQKIDVGRFSSITVIPNQYYCLYNTTYDQVLMEVGLSSYKAISDNFSVDLENDILYTKDNQKILLFTNTDVLDELK